MKVRMLVSDAFLDPSNPKDSTHTVDFVNEIARREGLDMQARIIKSSLLGLDKIHNKGVIVDEQKVLVSSINWSYNSPANNREVGLILDHPIIGQYYTDIFTYDWYDGTPADYPLITEVDPAAGFVELTHFGRSTIDVGGWTLQTATGRWTLPRSARLEPGKPLVLAADPGALQARFGRFDGLVALPGLTLAGTQGSLYLQQGSERIDGLAWGEAEPGWVLNDPAEGALCRENPGKDTNTYLDWTAGEATPGLAGCGK